MREFEITYAIPTLNSASTLDLTLLSLKQQKGVKVNVIVVDSGSTDGTLEICERWGVKALYADPGNMYRAINVGLRESKTEWCGYINSDDWLHSNILIDLLELGIRSNADVVYGNCDYTDQDGRFLHSMKAASPKWLISLAAVNILGFAQQSAIFRIQLYDSLGGFDENYRFAADFDFYLRALLSGSHFSYLPHLSTSCFRIHSTQLSNTFKQEMAFETKAISSKTQTAKGEGYFYYFLWRMRNLPHYAIRFLRHSSLLDKAIFSHSLEPLSR